MAQSQVKALIFTLLTLVAGVFFWQQILNIFSIHGGEIENIQVSDLIFLGIGLLVFLVFFLTLFILTENRGTVYLVVFLLNLIFALLYFQKFGFSPLNYYFLVSLLISLILLMIAYELMGIEKEDRLKLSVGRIWKRGLPMVIIALSLIISVIYYSHPFFKFTKDKIELPPQIMKWVMKPMGGIFTKVLPFYDPKMTIDEMLASSLAIGGEGGGIDISSLDPEILSKIPAEKLMTMDTEELMNDPAVKALIIQQITQKSKSVDPRLVAQQREDFAKSLGIKLTGKETMDEVMNKLVNVRFGEFIGPYYQWVSIGITVALFFLLKFIFSLVGIIAIISAQIFFALLKLVKVVEIVLVTKEGEALKL